jgi:hypothetical protein
VSTDAATAEQTLGKLRRLVLLLKHRRLPERPTVECRAMVAQAMRDRQLILGTRDGNSQTLAR